MSDTSTAQRNWLGLSNPLTANSVSPKEFVELPLLSNYNNAFLETITEEGSEFEPSEDGSASFDQSDYLPFDGLRRDQGTNTLVRNDATLMIGEVDSPDYEEVFPMSIQPFAALRKELFDYSNLLIPYSRSVRDTSALCGTGDQAVGVDASAKHTSSSLVKVDRSTDGGKDANLSDDLNKTSGYQSYDEEDRRDSTILEQTPGKTQTIKRTGSHDLSLSPTPRPVDCQPANDGFSTNRVTGSSEPWSDDDRDEDMLVLSAEGDQQKLVWKLETNEHSTTLNNNINESVKLHEHGISDPASQITVLTSDAPQDSSGQEVERDALLRASITTNDSSENPVGSQNAEMEQVIREDSVLKENGQNLTSFTGLQNTIIPAVPRPNLPQFHPANPLKIQPMEHNSVPPPKPSFPLHGMPDTLIAHVKHLHNSTLLRQRPPVPPRPNAQTVLSNANSTTTTYFPPTISYRELLSTSALSEPSKIPKSQSFQSTFVSQAFQPTYPLTDCSMTNSITIPLNGIGMSSSSNLEAYANPMTASFPGCYMQSRLNYLRSIQPQASCPIISHDIPSLTCSQSAHQSQTEPSAQSVVTQPENNSKLSNPFFALRSSNNTTVWLADKSHHQQTLSSEQAMIMPNTMTGGHDTGPRTDSIRLKSPNPVHDATAHDRPDSPGTAPDPFDADQLTQLRSINPPNNTCTSSKRKSPVWIANSTPLAHYYASHSAVFSKNRLESTGNGETYTDTGNYPSGTATIDSGNTGSHHGFGDNRQRSVQQQQQQQKQQKQSVTSTSLQTLNPRPIQRSFAVVGVSDLLAKTDEELNRFMQSTLIQSSSQTDKQRSDTQPTPMDESSNESSGNQLSSQSGQIDHSPVRRRFQSTRAQPAFHLNLMDPVDLESDSDNLDRRSFYDYGCDEDDEEEEDEIVDDLVSGHVSVRQAGRLEEQFLPPERPHHTELTYTGISDDLLRKLDRLNQETQIVWSDNCQVEQTSSQRLGEEYPNCDLPFIDSDSFLNEPLNNVGAWRLNYLRKPVRANLDEITLASDRSSNKNTWGSTTSLNYRPFEKKLVGETCSRLVCESDYDTVSPEESKRVRIRSRRDSHSYDSSTQSKQGSRLQKFTAPWLQRLCGCVRSSRFRRKESI